MTPEESAAYEAEREAAIAERLRADREAHRRVRLEYELGSEYSECDIDKHRVTPGNKTGIALARRIIDGRFIEGGGFHGSEFGNGKTALAACIAYAALTKYVHARFFTMEGIIKLVQAAFKDQQAKDEVETLARVPLLIIDEIDKLYLSESGWGVHEMFNIINARSSNRRPLVVTSNKAHDELPKKYAAQMRNPDHSLIGATVDRILGMTGGPRNWVKIEGNSERWKR